MNQIILITLFGCRLQNHQCSHLVKYRGKMQGGGLECANLCTNSDLGVEIIEILAQASK